MQARQGNAKRDEPGKLAENTAVLAGDFKINFGQFPGPSFLLRPGQGSRGNQKGNFHEPKISENFTETAITQMGVSCN